MRFLHPAWEGGRGTRTEVDPPPFPRHSQAAGQGHLRHTKGQGTPTDCTVMLLSERISGGSALLGGTTPWPPHMSLLRRRCRRGGGGCLGVRMRGGGRARYVRAPGPLMRVLLARSGVGGCLRGRPGLRFIGDVSVSPIAPSSSRSCSAGGCQRVSGGTASPHEPRARRTPALTGGIGGGGSSAGGREAAAGRPAALALCGGPGGGWEDVRGSHRGRGACRRRLRHAGARQPVTGSQQPAAMASGPQAAAPPQA